MRFAPNGKHLPSPLATELSSFVHIELAVGGLEEVSSMAITDST